MGRYLHTPWAGSQAGRLVRSLPILSAIAAGSASDHGRPIDVDSGGGGSNMLAPLTPWQRVTLSSGARLGPYEIVAPLGSGGMGVVYRAYDSRLNRIVAIKVLGSTADAAHHRQRFQREMRAIATLNHPHICALYDVGLQDDVEFFVM
jgi:serine/threonine protein kinase